MNLTYHDGENISFIQLLEQLVILEVIKQEFKAYLLNNHGEADN